MRTLADRLVSDRRLVEGELPDSPNGHWVSTDITASPVTIWPDRSGNGHDATQATVSQQPTLVANGLAGYPVVRFDGDDFLATSGWTVNQPYVVFAVARHSGADTAQRAVFGGRHTGTPGAAIYVESGVWRQFAGTNSVSTIAVDTDWHVVAASWGAGAGIFGVDDEGHAGPVNTRRCDNPHLGAYSLGTGPWSGDIAEIVFYERILSPWELGEGMRFLARKYGLDL